MLLTALGGKILQMREKKIVKKGGGVPKGGHIPVYLWIVSCVIVFDTYTLFTGIALPT